MAITKKFIKASRRFSTTIGAGGVANASATTIPLTTIPAVFSNGDPIEIVVDRVSTTGELTTNLEETILGIVSGSNIITADRGVEGTAQEHGAGSVVEIKLTADMWNRFVEGILAEHGDGGAHTDITADSLTLASSSAPAPTTVGLIEYDSDDDKIKYGDGAATNTLATESFVKNVTRTIVLPAGAMSPTTTGGCADSATVEAGTNDVDYKVLDFDKDTDENAFIGPFAMPDSWNGGAIKAKFIWTTAGTTGNVIWGIKGRAFANDDAIDQAYGTEQTVTDAFIAAGDIHISDLTSDLTLAGSPAGGQLVQLKVYRDADNGSDTLDADARLIAVVIEYGVNSNTD